jgi:outer membrane biosynthesis protein TonB
MRARWTYFSTGTLVAVALGAPFVLPRLMDSHGSAAFALEALAPPPAQNAVVRMAALPQPKRVPHAKHVVVRATPRVAVAHASLASVRPHTTPVAPRKAEPRRVVHINHWIRKHPPAPVETRRAPDPPPPPPPTPVVAVQPLNLNSTDQSAAPAPAAAAAPAPATQTATVAAVTSQGDQGSSGGDESHGNGKGHDQDHGNGNGHGHDHGV